jgi:hypothetical protein
VWIPRTPYKGRELGVTPAVAKVNVEKHYEQSNASADQNSFFRW